MDRGLLEQFGAFGFKNVIVIGMGKLSGMQDGKIYNYILVLAVYSFISL